jgi:putative selenium metabolism hydrolase
LTTVDQSLIHQIKQHVSGQRESIIEFLRELCEIPSYDSKIKEVAERAAKEMQALGFDEVRFDVQGNIIGRVGSGPKKIVYDSHIDTVGVGNLAEWNWDPFKGKVEDGILYARGACDEKGSTPGMIYGIALARDLGLLDGFTMYYYGNIEEWCDGIAPNVFVEVEKIRPDFVVIGEPTKMQVYRGHKGRVEMQIVVTGKSAHAASNHLGDNAIYKLLPIIERIANMEPELGDDPFLGHGKITVTDMKVETPSINAVPDKATIFIDRRMTFGETVEGIMAKMQEVVGDRPDVKLELLHYNDPAYNGFVFEVDKIFPSWALPADHPLVEAGQKTLELLNGKAPESGKWNFSTNGIYWMGKAGIPSIGFGPGDEVHAHTVIDQVKLEDVVAATEFYTLLPALLK